jgi:hypothetical protein
MMGAARRSHESLTNRLVPGGRVGSNVVLLLGFVLCGWFVARGHAEDAVQPAAAPRSITMTSQEDLDQRIVELEGRAPLAAEVAGPLDEAKRALARMREARARADRAQAERAEAVARASLTLAERRQALAVERELLRAASTRREAARQRRAHAEAARALEQRRVQELTVAPALSEAVAPSPAGAVQ